MQSVELSGKEISVTPRFVYCDGYTKNCCSVFVVVVVFVLFCFFHRLSDVLVFNRRTLAAAALYKTCNIIKKQ